MLNFGEALNAVKEGKRIARSGWNGKGMFVWLTKGSIAAGADGSVPSYVNGVRSSLFEIGDDGTVTRMPHLNMRAADGCMVTGWLASQTDMLAIDWEILPEEV